MSSLYIKANSRALIGLTAIYFIASCGVQKKGNEPSWIGSAIVTQQCGDSSSVASAVVLSDSEVLTSAHAVKCMSPLFVLVEGKAFVAVVYDVDLDNDMVKITIVGGKPRRIRPGPTPRVGDAVCAKIAYPRKITKCGRVLRVKSGPGAITSDIVVVPGNSGSGVYDNKWRLIGTVTYKICTSEKICSKSGFADINNSRLKW